MNNPEVREANQGNRFAESDFIDIPTVDELISLECRIRDIRAYYERAGVLNCLQKLSEFLKKTNDPNVPMDGSMIEWNKGYADGLKQAHKILDGMLRES